MSAAIVVYATDLIFTAKIRSTADLLDRSTEFFASAEALDDRVRTDSPELIIIDLNADGDPIQAVRNARQTAPDIRIIAYCSHVDADLAEEAKRAGAQQVMPRSAFSAKLPEILGGP